MKVLHYLFSLGQYILFEYHCLVQTIPNLIQNQANLSVIVFVGRAENRPQEKIHESLPSPKLPILLLKRWVTFPSFTSRGIVII